MLPVSSRLRRPALASWACLVVLLLAACRLRGSEGSLDDPPVPEAKVVARLVPEGVPPWSQGPPLAEPADPRLVDFGPEGRTDRWPRIYLRFDQAMQPPPEDAAPLIRLEPPVPGRVDWIDRYQAVFNPADTLASGHAYTVIARGDLSTSDGRGLTLDRRWRLEVDRTEVTLDVLQDDGSAYYVKDGEAPQANWHSRVGITVDRPTTRDALIAQLAVRSRPAGAPGARPRPVPFDVRAASEDEQDTWEYDVLDEPSMFVVEPRGHWPADARVEVEVGADFHARDDALGLGSAVVARFDTPRGLEVEASCAVPSEGGCEPAPIFLDLSNPILPRQVRKVRVDPRPEGLKIEADDPWDEGIERIVIGGRFEPGRRYTVELDPQMRDVHDQPLAAPLRREFEFVVPAPALRMSDSFGFLPADQPTTVGIESRWVERATLRVAVLEDETTLALLGRWPLESFLFPREGTAITERELSLDPKGPMGWSATTLDLADFTGKDKRAVLVEVVPRSLSAAAAGREMPRPARGLYQVTDLGALALVSSVNATARVARLSTGAPISGAEVQLFHIEDEPHTTTPIGRLHRTDAQGLSRLPTRAVTPSGSALMLVRDPATDDRFVAWLRGLSQLHQTAGADYRPGEEVLAHVVTERPLYRPGEKIRVVGWAAVSTPHTASGLRPARARSKVVVELVDDAHEVIVRREVALTEYGKFWATLRFPPRASLGRYEVHATIADTTARARLRLREFRIPSFAVEMASDRGDYLHGVTPSITARASYYFGGQVPIEKARRHRSCAVTGYRPPGLQADWVVGRSTNDDALTLDHQGEGEDVPLDPAQPGRVGYSFDLPPLHPEWPYHCTASLSLQDAGAAEVGAQVSFLVHPDRYLLMQSPPWRLDEGEAIAPRVRVVDFRGERVAPTAVEVEITRHYDATNARGQRVRRRETLATCSLKTAAAGPDPSCPLSRLAPGDYEIVARTADGGSKLEAQADLWVTHRYEDGDEDEPSTEGLTLALSNPTPVPGETLTLTVKSPDRRGRGLLTFVHGGLRRVEPFTLRDGRFEHAVEVTDAWIPGMHIEAILVREATATRRSLVERASAHAWVAADGRALRVEVRSPTTASPRQALPIDVFVRDAAGDPVAGHVALWAVDEAILSLEEPRIPDLVDAFIVRGNRQTDLHHDYERRLYPYVARSDPFDYGETFGLGNLGLIGKGGGGGTGARHVSGAPPVRRQLEATPIFLGDVAVDDDGHARAEGTLPDDLTTFRITAIASALLPGGDAIGRFGHADTRVRVTAPLVVQAALPRHLRPGDSARIAALVDNLGGPAGTVTVTLRADDPQGAIASTSARSRRVHVDAGAQVRVPFDVTARAPGRPALTLDARLVADQGEVRLADALETVVPVEAEPTLVRQVAVYGTLADDAPAAVAVQAPAGARPGSEALDVALSATLLGGAEDLVDGLVHYPYGCVEQTASRLLPLAALGALAEHVPLGVENRDDWVSDGIARLRSMQVDDGGLAYWPGAPQAHAYATAYAAWVLQQLSDAGYAVPKRFMASLRRYLAARIEGWASHGTPTVEDDLRLAMALVALAAGGRASDEHLTALHARRDQLPRFGQALLTIALHTADPRDPRATAMADTLLADLDEREGFAHVRDDGRWLGAFFDSGPRTEAMVLMALLRAAPDDRRVPKLVRGLMVLRRDGALRNTQERAHALLALAWYARHFEAEVPAFDTGVWADADFVGRSRFEGRSARVEAYTLPLPWVDADAPAAAPASGHRVTLSRTGQGRMYYRVAMRWSPRLETIEPHAAGIAVERTLRVAGGPVGEHEVVAQGERVALDLTVTTQESMSYVAIDIPLPAGLEAVDTSIGSGRRAMVLGGVQGYWVTHDELRTERVLLFADHLSPGEHRHTVYLRAVTPGRYVMPPTHAEAMYYPEVQGNTASQTIEIR